MHISLPSDASRTEAASGPEGLNELMTDPVWMALQNGLTQLGPHVGEAEVQTLLARLHEHKMMEQLQDLLQHLPEESQQLLDSLQDRLQSA